MAEEIVGEEKKGFTPFLHMIRSADAIEASSPSKVGPGRSLGRGRQGEEVRLGEESVAILQEMSRLETSWRDI